MNNTTQILEENGFTQLFPFVDHFRKKISETSIIKIHTCYKLKRNDIIQDSDVDRYNRYFNVTLIDLPSIEVIVFSKLENVINYIDSTHKKNSTI